MLNKMPEMFERKGKYYLPDGESFSKQEVIQYLLKGKTLVINGQTATISDDGKGIFLTGDRNDLELNKIIEFKFINRYLDILKQIIKNGKNNKELLKLLPEDEIFKIKGEDFYKIIDHLALRVDNLIFMYESILEEIRKQFIDESKKFLNTNYQITDFEIEDNKKTLNKIALKMGIDSLSDELKIDIKNKKANIEKQYKTINLIIYYLFVSAFKQYKEAK